MLDLVIAAVLGLSPPESSRDDSSCETVLRTVELDHEAFAAAVRLRLPALHLHDASDHEREPACGGRLYAYVEVRPLEPGRWELTLIFSDGRAWFRTIVSEPDEAARTAASALANLLAAIEDDELDPDANDVALPIAATREPTPEPLSEVEPPAELEPEPPRPIVLELGPRVGFQPSAGAYPGAGYRAFGGQLGLDLRTPSGLLVALDVRLAGRSAGELSLLRTRVGLGLGYALRVRRFELPMLVRAQIEPWIVLDSSGRAPLGAPPLLGGGIRIAPGGRFELGRTVLRIGAAIDLDLMGEPLGGRVPLVRLDPTSATLFHVGGVELGVGFELALWFPVRER